MTDTATPIANTAPAALVRALEERAFNAWPAHQTVFHRGWVLRLSGGYTKRANSVNALVPGAASAAGRASSVRRVVRFIGRSPPGLVGMIAPATSPRPIAYAMFARGGPS